MSITEVILSGALLSFISGIIGVAIGSKNKVEDKTCIDHRIACSTLLGTKIDGLSKRVDELKKSVDSKLSII